MVVDRGRTRDLDRWRGRALRYRRHMGLLASSGAVSRSRRRAGQLVRRVTGRWPSGPLTGTLPLPTAGEIARLESRNVDSVLAALGAAGIRHFLIPRPEPHNVHLGIAESDALALLDALTHAAPAAHVSWAAESGWRTAVAGAARASITDRPTILWIHHDQRVRTRADARDAARGVAVELWRPGQSGDLEAPTQNPYASVVSLRTPPVIAQARTGRRVATLPAFATPDIGEVRFPVDAAYLWVDGADPQWQRRRDDALRDLGGPAESMDASRFRQHDELRYSLRSLSMFAPWIRHVYLVTDGQAPPWLDRSCTRLTLIDHRELMGDAGRLPTFNSHALAARLHHIDGLADHFVYLNDDVFFGRRTGAELWFAGNGQPRFHNTATKVEPGDLDDLTPHAAARNHTLEIVRRLTGRERRRNLQHGPHAFSKQLLLELEALLPDEFSRTWHNQVRRSDDLVVEWLHHQYGYCTGRAVDSRVVRYEYVNIGQPDVTEVLERIRQAMPHTLCLNDGTGPNPAELRARIVRDFLRTTFPTPSEFELGSALEA